MNSIRRRKKNIKTKFQKENAQEKKKKIVAIVILSPIKI